MVFTIAFKSTLNIQPTKSIRMEVSLNKNVSTFIPVEYYFRKNV